jgi:phosphoglucomutase
VAEHKYAGKKAPYSLLENIPRLISAYYTREPDPDNVQQAVSFGTSGHRGTSLNSTFNEDHILAVSQAVADYRKKNRIRGPLFLGIDTHALSEPALISAIEVFAANDIEIRYQKDFGYTPTPAFLMQFSPGTATAPGKSRWIVITPSHNPPSDGGFKYNATHGGPAGTEITKKIENAANLYLKKELSGVKRIPFEKALKKESTQRPMIMLGPYIDDWINVVDLEVIRKSGLKIGADPMGGSGIGILGADCRKI